MLISPLAILNASGISSKLVALSIFPNLVSLSLSGNKFPFSSFASVIVLNLYNLNIFSSFPGLSCVKITGEPNFTLTNIAIIRYNHEKTIIAIKLHIKSNGLFIYFSYGPYGLCFIFSITNSSILLEATLYYFNNSILLFYCHFIITRQA